MSLNFKKIEEEHRRGLHYAHRELARQLGLSTEHWDCFCGLFNHFEKKPLSLVQLHTRLTQELKEYIQRHRPSLIKKVDWLW